MQLELLDRNIVPPIRESRYTHLLREDCDGEVADTVGSAAHVKCGTPLLQELPAPPNVPKRAKSESVYKILRLRI